MSETKEKGFTFNGTFVPLSVTEKGKDLMLIDRLTQRPPQDVMDELGEGVDVRGTSALALVACSLRAAFPDLSVQRILDIVEQVDLGELEWSGLEEEAEEVDARPPDQKTSGSDGPSAESNSSPDSPSEPQFATPV